MKHLLCIPNTSPSPRLSSEHRSSTSLNLHLTYRSDNMSTTRVVGWGECSLETCSVDLSIFKYRPSLAASGTLIALFGLSAILHAFQGFKYRQWTFMILMAIGCLCEMVGYGGRIILYHNPWSFGGFIMQIGEFNTHTPPPGSSNRS